MSVRAAARALAATFVGVVGVVGLGGPPPAVGAAAPPAELGFPTTLVDHVVSRVGTVRSAIKLGTGWNAGDGLVVTDHHVSSLKINQLTYVPQGAPAPVDCYTVIAAESLDISVLRCDGLPTDGLPLRSEDPPVGTPVFTAGYPGGQLATSGGHITASSVEVLSGDRLGYDVAAAPGASGSPVVDADGRVISSIIGTYGPTTFGSRASEIAPLLRRAAGAPATLELAMAGLALRRVWPPLAVLVLPCSWAFRRAGRGRWGWRSAGLLVAVAAVIVTFTVIQVESSGVAVLLP